MKWQELRCFFCLVVCMRGVCVGFRSEYPFGVPLGGVGISGAGEYIGPLPGRDWNVMRDLASSDYR
jgi:hypothetical protein